MDEKKSNFTTEDVIGVLYFDKQEEKQKLLNDFSHADESGKYELATMYWDAFLELTDEMAQLRYQQFLEEVAARKRKLSSTMMTEAYRQAHQDCRNILSGKWKEFNALDDVREKIKNLMQYSSHSDADSSESTPKSL